MRITATEQDHRKQTMIHSAYELFCKQGIDEVSMAMIAQKSGVSSNSMFRYFGTKAQLILCTQAILWEEIVAHILKDSAQELMEATNGFEEIRILTLNFQKFYEDHSEYLVFACDYKLYLVRQKIKLSKEMYQSIINPVYETFIKALSKGRMDGSVSVREGTTNQFFALWGVLRGYVEQIVIYDRMYGGENPWRGNFHLVLHYALEALKAKP